MPIISQEQQIVAQEELSDKDIEKSANGSKGVAVAGNIYVTWDGSEDPTHPRNWSLAKKSRHVLLVALITFLT